MTSGTFEWREPGPARRGFGGPSGEGVWVGRLKPLMEHPGRWAVIHKSDTSGKASGMAASLRNPKTQVPPGKWEFAARDGEVFARYIGPE